MHSSSSSESAIVCFFFFFAIADLPLVPAWLIRGGEISHAWRATDGETTRGTKNVCISVTTHATRGI